MPATSSSPPPNNTSHNIEPRAETASTDKTKSTATSETIQKPSAENENDPARTGSQLSSNQSQDQNI